ncbi:MAG: TRAP transporter small permease [Methanosarcinaceae archaeon]
MKIINLFDSWLAKIENGLLVFLLSAMILFAFFQIPLSKFFPLESIEILLRHLVLWVGLLGATLATREGRHINIDILSRFVKGRLKRIVNLLTSFFSALICGLLTYASWLVIQDAKEFGETVHIFIDLPTWLLQLILLAGFGIMTFRFVLKMMNEIAGWLPGQEAAQ